VLSNGRENQGPGTLSLEAILKQGEWIAV
jgi:hypothetical protein